VTDGLCSLSRSGVLIFCCDAMLITPTAALRQVQPEVSAAAVKKGKRQLAAVEMGNPCLSPIQEPQFVCSND